MGADTNIVVKVNTGSWGIRGTAQRCNLVRVGDGWETTIGGYFRLSFPSKLSMEYCWEVVKIVLHEWGHIVDYQNGHTEFSIAHNGRRPRHDDRVEEVRCRTYVDYVISDLGYEYFEDDVIKLYSELKRINQK